MTPSLRSNNNHHHHHPHRTAVPTGSSLKPDPVNDANHISPNPYYYSDSQPHAHYTDSYPSSSYMSSTDDSTSAVSMPIPIPTPSSIQSPSSSSSSSPIRPPFFPSHPPPPLSPPPSSLPFPFQYLFSFSSSPPTPSPPLILTIQSHHLLLLQTLQYLLNNLLTLLIYIIIQPITSLHVLLRLYCTYVKTIWYVEADVLVSGFYVLGYILWVLLVRIPVFIGRDVLGLTVLGVGVGALGQTGVGREVGNGVKEGIWRVGGFVREGIEGVVDVTRGVSEGGKYSDYAEGDEQEGKVKMEYGSGSEEEEETRRVKEEEVDDEENERGSKKRKRSNQQDEKKESRFCNGQQYKSDRDWEW